MKLNPYVSKNRTELATAKRTTGLTIYLNTTNRISFSYSCLLVSIRGSNHGERDGFDRFINGTTGRRGRMSGRKEWAAVSGIPWP